MIAHLSCGGYAAYMIRTIASNVHKSKEKALSRLLEQQPAYIVETVEILIYLSA